MGRTRQRKPDVFVSYSREHINLVTPLVQLLTASGRLIFQDVNSIRPGDEWNKLILESVTNATCFFLIWCDHARTSPWVEKEWRLAVRLKKRVIPVRIDNTPLPRSLRRFQHIDMSTIFAHNKDGCTGNLLDAGVYDNDNSASNHLMRYCLLMDSSSSRATLPGVPIATDNASLTFQCESVFARDDHYDANGRILIVEPPVLLNDILIESMDSHLCHSIAGLRESSHEDVLSEAWRRVSRTRKRYIPNITITESSDGNWTAHKPCVPENRRFLPDLSLTISAEVREVTRSMVSTDTTCRSVPSANSVDLALASIFREPGRELECIRPDCESGRATCLRRDEMVIQFSLIPEHLPGQTATFERSVG